MACDAARHPIAGPFLIHFMSISKTARIAACLALTAAPLVAAQAQDERLSVHGSATIGYGKSDNLQILGVTKDGTTDYRLVVLQFGYQLSSKDRVVTQLRHRRVGNSPLNGQIPPFEPIWAFYEHKFDNGYTLKAGRNPLPRGIYNEVRYIGTLLPTFRVGNAVYGETHEFIDGVVLRKPFDLGGNWRLDASVYGGGYDLRATVPVPTGVVAFSLRNENTFGGQLWLNTPIDGVRFGVFMNNYQITPNATLPKEQRNKRTTNMLYSAEAVGEKVFVRSELTTFKQTKLPNFLDYAAYYVQAGVNVSEKFTVVGEYSDGRNMVNFPGTQIPTARLPLNQDFTLGFSYKPSPSVSFKLEGHRVKGYEFDTPVPSISVPSQPPLVASLAPASKTFYGIASVAFSF